MTRLIFALLSHNEMVSAHQGHTFSNKDLLSLILILNVIQLKD